MEDVEVINRMHTAERIVAMQQYTQVAVNLRALPAGLHGAALQLLRGYGSRRMRQDGFSSMLIMRSIPAHYLVALGGRGSPPRSAHLQARIMEFARSELGIQDTGYRHVFALRPGALLTDFRCWSEYAFEWIDLSERPQLGNSIEHELGAPEMGFLLEGVSHLGSVGGKRIAAMEHSARAMCGARITHVALLASVASPGAPVDVRGLASRCREHAAAVGVSGAAHLSNALDMLVCELAEDWARQSVGMFDSGVCVDDLAHALQTGMTSASDCADDMDTLKSLGSLALQGTSGTFYKEVVEPLVERFDIAQASLLGAFSHAVLGREDADALCSFLRRLATACASCRSNFAKREFGGLAQMLQSAAHAGPEVAASLRQVLSQMTCAGAQALVVPLPGGSLRLPSFAASARASVLVSTIRHACKTLSGATWTVHGDHPSVRAFRRRVLFLVDELLVAYHDSLEDVLRNAMPHFFAQMSAVESEKVFDILNDLFDILDEPPATAEADEPIAEPQESAARDAAAIVIYEAPGSPERDYLVYKATVDVYQFLVSRVPSMHACVLRPSPTSPLPLPTPGILRCSGLEATVRVAFAIADKITRMALENHRSGGIRPSDALEVDVNRDVKPFIHDLEPTDAAQTANERAVSMVIRQLGACLGHSEHGARGGASVATNDTKSGKLSRNPKRTIAIRSVDALNRTLVLLALYIAKTMHVKIPWLEKAQRDLFGRPPKRKTLTQS